MCKCEATGKLVLAQSNFDTVECLSCTADATAESKQKESKTCGLVTYPYITQETMQTTVIYYARGKSKAVILACLRLRHDFEHSCDACSGLLNCPPRILQWLLCSLYTSVFFCLASLQLTLQVLDEVVGRSLLRSSFCCDLAKLCSLVLNLLLQGIQLQLPELRTLTLFSVIFLHTSEQSLCTGAHTFAQTRANTTGKALYSILSLPGHSQVLSLCLMRPTLNVTATHSFETSRFASAVTALSSFSLQDTAATVMAANVALMFNWRPASYSNKQHKPAFHEWLAGLACDAAEAPEGPPPSASPEPGPAVLHLPSQLRRPGLH